MSVESGVITRDIEQFVCINLKLDAENAIDIEEALEKLIATDVLNMLPEEGKESLIKLHTVLEASLIKYQNEFNEYGEYEGKTNEESWEWIRISISWSKSV